MGRNKFSQSEVNAIRRLLALKNKANRFGQKQISHLDDATIADMKAKRARDRERDAAAQAEAAPISEGSDWQEAMKQWQAWEESTK